MKKHDNFCIRGTLALLALGYALTVLTDTARASLFHLQDISHVDANGNAYISWEAENFTSTNVRSAGAITWGAFNDASASNLTALLADDGNLAANNGAVSPSGSTSNIVTYDLKFVEAGTYSLYWLGRAGGSGDGIGGAVGGNDGWFAPAGGFGDDAPDIRVNGHNVSDLVRLGGTSTGDNYTTSYQWFRQGGTTNARIDFIVTPANVANGDLLSLSMATREDGLLIDRWILSENSTLFSSTAGDTAAKLNAFSMAQLVVPEPDTYLWGTLSAVGVMLLMRRRFKPKQR